MLKAAPDKLIRIAAVVELIGLDEDTIYAGKAKTGELLRIKPSEVVLLFSFNDVQAWIARRKAEAKAAIEKPQPAPRRLALVGTGRLSRTEADRIIAAHRAP